MYCNDDDYYEMVSDDDGSIVGDDENQHSTLKNKGLAQVNETLSFDFEDLPFVPKFSSEIRNTVEAAKNSENDSLETPLVGDWGSRPNISESRSSSLQLNCPYFPNQQLPTPESYFDCESSQSLTTVSTESCLTQSNSLIQSCPLPSSKAIVVNSTSEINSDLPDPSVNLVIAGNEDNVNTTNFSSWVDENGDPIQGAFDDIDPSSASDPCVNIINNTKVEYVFHVKEKKSDSEVGSVSQGISQGTVLSSLANLAPNSLENKTLNTDDIKDCETQDVYDQKKLYEASKNKQELSKVISEVESTASASESENVYSKKKTEHFVFKRNNFINQKRVGEDEDVPEDTVEQGTSNPNEADKALESQALNELLKEVKQGAERAKSYGALGWQKQPIPVVNKRFLKNTLVSTLREPYKPPGIHGRFHTGLNNERDHGSDSSSSSGSRSSRSSSRGSSYSSSSSHSRRSHSRSCDRKRHRHGRKGAHPGPWPGGPPNAYYDWAAMGQYGGYPWYDPEALAMYYGTDRYPEMYYDDPQFWAAYRDFYGMGFNPAFRGRGQRGVGWRGRGRGRGGGGMELEENWNERFSDSSSFSRSRSRSRSVSLSKGRRSHSRGSSHGSKSRRDKSEETSRRSRIESEDSGSKTRVKDSQTKDEKHRSGQGNLSDQKVLDNSIGKKQSRRSRSTSQVSEKEGAEPKGNEKKRKKKKKKHKKMKRDDKVDGVEMDQSSGRVDGEEKETKEKKSDDSEKVPHVRKVIKRKLGKEDSEQSKVVKKKKKTVGMKGDQGEVKKKKKKSGVNLKGKKSAKKDSDDSKSSKNVEKVDGINMNAEVSSVIAMADDNVKCDRNLEEAARVNESGEIDQQREEKIEYAEIGEKMKKAKSITESESMTGEMEQLQKCDNEQMKEDESESRRKEKGNVDGEKSGNGRLNQADSRRKIKDDNYLNDEERGGKDVKKYTDRIEGKKETNVKGEKNRRRSPDNFRAGRIRKEQNYVQTKQTDRNMQGGSEKVKRGGKIEEIERRLQERKAKRRMEDNAIRNDKGSKEGKGMSEIINIVNVKDKMDEGSRETKDKPCTDDSNRRKRDDGNHKNDIDNDVQKKTETTRVKDGSKQAKKVVEKKVKSQKKNKDSLDTASGDKGGKDKSVKKKKKVKRKSDGDQEIPGKIKNKDNTAACE